MTAEIVRLVYLALALGAEPLEVIKTCRGHHVCETVVCDYVQGNSLAEPSTLLSYCHRRSRYEEVQQV
jgi:hypothetical protein